MSLVTALLGNRMGSKVSIAYNGCWIWTGAKHSGGYAWTAPRFGTQLAHRISYILKNGPIPEKLHIDHLCRNRACVNPKHLEAVTQRVNTLRGITLAAANQAKTHCPRGHEYTGDNLILNSSSGRIKRYCKQCSKERIRG